MTRTVRTSLGTALLVGKHAVDQTRQFKCQLSSLLKKPDGVTLLTVEDVESRCRGVTAVYDADDTCSMAWAKQAEDIAAELWRVLAERRKGPAK